MDAQLESRSIPATGAQRGSAPNIVAERANDLDTINLRLITRPTMEATVASVEARTVLITGAARGMGEIYARRAVAEGARAAILWDLDQAALDEVSASLEGSSTKIHAQRVDISDLDDITESAAKARKAVGAPDILINNAGIVRAGAFWEHDPVTGIDATMRINTIAHMWITREFLPDMMADTATPKHILNIASAAGTVANPGMTVYAASKWAMIGWSDSLRLELRKKGHGHVRVTTFCPSYISTGMFEGARGPVLVPIMTPKKATDAAWRAMLRGKPILYRPWTVRLSPLLRGVLPIRAFDFVADRLFGVYSTMDHFTGRPATPSGSPASSATSPPPDGRPKG